MAHHFSQNLDTIKNQLKDLDYKLSSFKPAENIPQLIDKANLLRENEVFKKINEQKSELLDVYSTYTEILEQLISTQKTRKKIIKNTRKASTIRKQSTTKKSQKRKKVKKIKGKRKKPKKR